MTNYRQSMADALEFMNIMREYRILERDLTDTEKKRREEIAQEMVDGDFKDRYGARWKEGKMATATKQAKKESGDGPLSTVDEAAYYMPKGRELKALKKLMSQPTVPIGNMDSEDNILAKGQLPIGDKELDKDLEDLYDKKGSKGDAKNIIKKAMKRLGIKEEVLDEGTWQMPVGPKGRAGLKKLMKKPIKAKDAIDAIDPYIGDDELWDDIGELDDKDPNQDARPLIRAAMKRLKIKEDMEVYGNAISKLVSEHKGKKPHKHPHPEGGPLATVDEKFTMKDFKSNEDGNDHTQNAVELVKMFGDNYEKRQVAQIQKDHDKNRSISAKDQKVRDALIKKYLPQLEEDLDEKVRYSAPTKDGKNTFQVIDRDTKGMRGKQDDYKMVIVDKKGKVVKDWGSHISVDGAVMMAKNKKIIEDVELDEGSNSDVIVMKKGRVGKSVLPDAREIKKLEKEGWKIEGVIEKGSKILHKDPKRIMKAIKGGDKLGIGESLEEGKMKELHMYIQQKKSAEWIAKKMGLDVKTVKELMPEETVLERVSRFLESARSDAMKAMRKSGEFKDKDDDDVTASDDDVKAASKNIIAQMRKVVSLRGKFKVEFQDGKKEKIDPKIAAAIQKKYNSMRRPADKEKFQSQISKSKKDLLNALQESLQEADPPSKAAAAGAEIQKKKKIAQDKAKTDAIKKAKAKKGEAEQQKKTAAADSVQTKLAAKQSAEKDKKTMQQAKGADQASATQANVAKQKEADKAKRDAKIAQAKKKTDADAEKREKERAAQQHKSQLAASYNPILSRIDEKIQERKNG